MRFPAPRCYVTRVEGRAFRRYKVVQSEISASPRTGRHIKITYTTVSRHFTAEGARKAAKRLNNERGHSAA